MATEPTPQTGTLDGALPEGESQRLAALGDDPLRLIESSPDCIKLLDLDGKILSVNASALDILEIDDFEILADRPWIDLWADDHRQDAAEALDRAREGAVGRFIGYQLTPTGQPTWWDVVVSSVDDETGRPERLIAIARDVTRRAQDERTLRDIAEGTAEATGKAFFHSLVRHLASALDVRFAFATECLGPTRNRVRTLAFWKGDDFGENVEYDVGPTPCRTVIGGDIAYYPREVQAIFPQDRDLIELGATSYLGIPLIDASLKIIGHLAILDDRPMEVEPRSLSVLKVFAARAAAELERLKAEERRHAILEVNNAVIGTLNRQALFEATTQALRRIIPFDRAAIFLYDDDRDVLRLAAFESAVPSDAFRIGVELPIEGNHVGEAFRQQNYVLRQVLENDDRLPIDAALHREGFRSLLVVPLIARGASIGTINIASRSPDDYSASDAEFVQEAATQIALAIENMKAYEKVAELMERLEAENVYLREEIETHQRFDEIVGEDPELERVLTQIEQVAPTDSTVLLQGETGTGKELFARAIHRLSARAEGPLVVVNCGTISAGLVESELFGHEKGAFTGATARKIGRFELADGGSLFLDEIGELPPDLQVKLLRVLQEREIERVGGTTTIRVDVRVIAATNRDLRAAVEDGDFRSDLFYRIHVFPIQVPPLRERRGDIPLLVQYFVSKLGPRLGRRIDRIPRRTMDTLVAYDWPGNVRELRNVLERSIIISRGDKLELGEWPLGGDLSKTDGRERTLADIERDHIVQTLGQTGWVVSGDRGAAKILGLKPTTLEARMKKHGIERPPSE